jgi:hypothetical protein
MVQFDEGGDSLSDGISVAESVGPFDRVVHSPLPTVFADVAELAAMPRPYDCVSETPL